MERELVTLAIVLAGLVLAVWLLRRASERSRREGARGAQ
jgi:hypothetical protein